MIAVIVNPRSRGNRRNPKFAAELQSILGDTGRVFAPASLEDLAQVAGELRGAAPQVIGIHGGDGTLHKTLTALVRAWDGQPLPPLAPLCGGTMNVVASSLGIRDRPDSFVRHIVEGVRTGQPLETLRRRCIQVGDLYGFIFGNGLMANFLTEYYAPGKYGAGRALWLIMRTMASAIVLGPFVRRVFDRFRGRVEIDGSPLPWSDFVSIGAATVSEVGLGFKLIHRADDDPERFGMIAIHAGPLSLVRDLVPVRAGRGISNAHAYSAIATTMTIVPTDGAMAYTIDGDLYRMEGALSVNVGPALDLVKPAGGSLIRLPKAAG